MITHKQLLERLFYDKETGIFTWKPRPENDRFAKTWNSRFGWTNAGTVLPIGYLHITIEGRRYFAHRLAWLHVYGRWPSRQIDHIDGNKLNNAVANLREATNAENHWNNGKPSTNTSGFKGVTWNKQVGKWQAQIKFAGRNQYLGRFADPAEAAKAYAEAAARLHGEFAHGA